MTGSKLAIKIGIWKFSEKLFWKIKETGQIQVSFISYFNAFNSSFKSTEHLYNVCLWHCTPSCSNMGRKYWSHDRVTGRCELSYSYISLKYIRLLDIWHILYPGQTWRLRWAGSSENPVSSSIRSMIYSISLLNRVYLAYWILIPCCPNSSIYESLNSRFIISWYLLNNRSTCLLYLIVFSNCFCNVFNSGEILSASLPRELYVR